MSNESVFVYLKNFPLQFHAIFKKIHFLNTFKKVVIKNYFLEIRPND